MLAMALPMAATADVNGTASTNKHLTNLGPAAYDLAIVLEGTYGVYQTCPGYKTSDLGPVGWFSGFNPTFKNGNTVLHWQSFDDGPGIDNSQIDTNQTIHVGYSAPEDRKVVDMYWTDLEGKRIGGSIVYDVHAGKTYKGSRFSVILENVQQATASLKNIRYAVLSEPLPLDQLSDQNAELESALSSLSSDLGLAPGEAISLEIPVSVPESSAVVVIYEVNAEGSGASVVNHVQMIAE